MWGPWERVHRGGEGMWGCCNHRLRMTGQVQCLQVGGLRCADG